MIKNTIVLGNNLTTDKSNHLLVNGNGVDLDLIMTPREFDIANGILKQFDKPDLWAECTSMMDHLKLRFVYSEGGMRLDRWDKETGGFKVKIGLGSKMITDLHAKLRELTGSEETP